MTELHIRHNVRHLLKLTAAAVKTTRMPDGNTVADKVCEYRIRAAALIMPKGSTLHIQD